MREEEIGKEVVDAAVRIHRDLGPGLLESVYDAILAQRLRKRGLHVDRQVAVTLDYEGLKFEEAFRADLVVGLKVIVQIKCVETLTYLRLTDRRLGYLLNFSEDLMKNGITRTVHHFHDSDFCLP